MLKAWLPEVGALAAVSLFIATFMIWVAIFATS